jgi:hypothetical protein
MKRSKKQSQSLKKKVAQLESTVDKYENAAKCYLCCDVLQMPVSVCRFGHMACTRCVAHQMQNYHLEMSEFDMNNDCAETYAPDEDMLCGICREHAHFSYPGMAVMRLLPNSLFDTTCFLCNEVQPADLFSVHVLQACRKRLVACETCGILFRFDHADHHHRFICTQHYCTVENCQVKGCLATIKLHIDKHHDMIVKLATLTTFTNKCNSKFDNELAFQQDFDRLQKVFDVVVSSSLSSVSK